MNKLDFSEPRRQNPIAIALFLYKFFKRMIRGFWPILIVILFRGGKQSNFEMIMTGLFALAGGLTLFGSLVSYFRYYFLIENDTLVIRKGLFNKSETNVPFERIQNINFEQNLIHRVFSVYQVTIETAGSTASEIQIDALTQLEAESLRSFILARKKGLAEINETLAEAEDTPETAAPYEELLALSLLDLIKVGVSQNHLRTVAVIIGVGFSFADNIAEVIGFNLWDYAIENTGQVVVSVPILSYLFIGFILVFIGFIVTLIRTIIRFFGLRFSKSEDGFRLMYGLINKHETSLRKEKVQIIRWADNPLRRLFGIFTLDIHQAASSLSRRGVQKVEVPGAYLNQIDQVRVSCFPESENQVYDYHGMSKAYVWRNSIYIVLIPAIILLGLFFVIQDFRFLAAGLIIPSFVLGFLYQYHRNYRVGFSTEMLETNKGVFNKQTTLIPIYKVQSVSLRQSIYQRRKGLANLTIYTAGGTETITYIPLDIAQKAADYMLYHVESSQRTWM